MKRATILCIPEDIIFSDGLFEGFQEVEKFPQMDSKFSDLSAWFGPRTFLEESPQYKQLIPYVLVCSGEYIGVYTRATSGGENRLHNMGSIGFGGHVSVVDAVCSGESILVQETLQKSLARELEEELGITKSYPSELLGYIYDPSNEVGKVHLGIVYTWEIDPNDIGTIEDHIENFQFMKKSELHTFSGEFESWSKLIIEKIYS